MRDPRLTDKEARKAERLKAIAGKAAESDFSIKAGSTSSSSSTTTTTTIITLVLTLNTTDANCSDQTIVLDVSGTTIDETDSVEITIDANSVQSAMDSSYVAATTLANSDIENEYGLKLHLDASNYKSYTGVGSTWYDLSGNGYDVTLSNCGFTTTNYGGVTFNGSTSYGDLAIANLLTGTTPFTIIAAVTTNATTPAAAVIGNYGSTTLNTLWFSAAYGLWINSTSPYFAGYPIAAATRIIAVTRDSSNLCTLYKNGVSDGTATNSASIATAAQNWRIGADAGTGNEQLDGTIYMLKVYNVGFSSSRILSVYNQYKARYGLS